MQLNLHCQLPSVILASASVRISSCSIAALSHHPCREFVKDLEAARPTAIIDLIHSAETMQIDSQAEKNMPAPRTCERCGYISSQPVCKACVLLEGLNRGLPHLGVSRTRGSKDRRAGLPAELQRDAGEGRGHWVRGVRLYCIE